MKAYETLELEVIKFEAQDVITASVEAPVEDNAPVEDEVVNVPVFGNPTLDALPDSVKVEIMGYQNFGINQDGSIWAGSRDNIIYRP